MPIATLQIIEGRPPELKAALIRAVTLAIAETLLVKQDSVRVLLHEIPAAHWGIGGVTAQELGR